MSVPQIVNPPVVLGTVVITKPMKGDTHVVIVKFKVAVLSHPFELVVL